VLVRAAVLAILVVLLIPFSSLAQSESMIDDTASLASNLATEGAEIQGYASQTFYRNLNLLGDGPRSYGFLITRFTDPDAAVTALPLIPQYYASMDASYPLAPAEAIEEVGVSKLGDDQYALYGTDDDFSTVSGYLAVQIGSIVFYGESRGTMMNPLTPLVGFARTSLECLAQHPTETNDDLAYCLPTFDLMPVGMEEFLQIDPNYTPQPPAPAEPTPTPAPSATSLDWACGSTPVNASILRQSNLGPGIIGLTGSGSAYHCVDLAAGTYFLSFQCFNDLTGTAAGGSSSADAIVLASAKTGTLHWPVDGTIKLGIVCQEQWHFQLVLSTG